MDKTRFVSGAKPLVTPATRKQWPAESRSEAVDDTVTSVSSQLLTACMSSSGPKPALKWSHQCKYHVSHSALLLQEAVATGSRRQACVELRQQRNESCKLVARRIKLLKLAPQASTACTSLSHKVTCGALVLVTAEGARVLLNIKRLCAAKSHRSILVTL